MITCACCRSDKGGVEFAGDVCKICGWKEDGIDRETGYSDINHATISEYCNNWAKDNHT